MIARQQNVENDPESIQSKFKTKFESKDYLSEILPFASGCLKTYTREKLEQKQKIYRMTAKQLYDYRVPLNVLMQYTQAL